MASRRKRSKFAHKRGQFKCQKCGHTANGPFKLGLHYKKYPSHASAKSVNQKVIRQRQSPTQRTDVNMRERTTWLESFLSGKGRVPPAVVFDADRMDKIGSVGVMRKAADFSKHISRFATGKSAMWEFKAPKSMEIAPQTTWEHTNPGELPLETTSPPKARKKRMNIKFCPDCGYDLRDF